MTGTAPPPAKERIAEGLWKLACDKFGPDAWDKLPEDQKKIWLGCADNLAEQWIIDVNHYPY